MSDVTSSLQFAASCDENTEGYSGSARSPTAEALRAEFGRVKCSQEMGELRYFSEKKKKSLIVVEGKCLQFSLKVLGDGDDCKY